MLKEKGVMQTSRLACRRLTAIVLQKCCGLDSASLLDCISPFRLNIIIIIINI